MSKKQTPLEKNTNSGTYITLFSKIASKGENMKLKLILIISSLISVSTVAVNSLDHYEPTQPVTYKNITLKPMMNCETKAFFSNYPDKLTTKCRILKAAIEDNLKTLEQVGHYWDGPLGPIKTIHEIDTRFGMCFHGDEKVAAFIIDHLYGNQANATGFGFYDRENYIERSIVQDKDTIRALTAEGNGENDKEISFEGGGMAIESDFKRCL